MSENGSVIIRPMLPDDSDSCMALSSAEDWNQTLSDWKRLAEGPLNQCLVAESDNKIISTATAMNYLNKVAWIGMVLVDKEYRGKGIGKLMVTSLLNLLGSCKSVKLDATPAGENLYKNLGFTGEYSVIRMISSSQNIMQQEDFPENPVTAEPSDISEISILDRNAFGAERIYLLNSIIKENPGKAWCIKQKGRLIAFSLGRNGRKYLQIGPVIAPGISEAKDMISIFCAEFNGIVLDVLADKVELIQWLEQKGFICQRKFLRMYLHQNPYPGNISNNYLIFGPEFG